VHKKLTRLIWEEISLAPVEIGNFARGESKNATQNFLVLEIKPFANLSSLGAARDFLVLELFGGVSADRSAEAIECLPSGLGTALHTFFMRFVLGSDVSLQYLKTLNDDTLV
tara:strand:+ start:815 stop:1150 length:336 start_codon:yes stop_codon:yes gene_type:complete